MNKARINPIVDLLLFLSIAAIVRIGLLMKYVLVRDDESPKNHSSSDMPNDVVENPPLSGVCFRLFGWL